MDSSMEDKKFVIYSCVVCQKQTYSVNDLHCHQIQTHSLEELSFGIISIQGFASTRDLAFLKPFVGYGARDYGIRITSDGNNNNPFPCAYNGQMSGIKYKSRRVTFPSLEFEETPSKSTHDQTSCSLNCNPFIPWEQELYKGIIVNDEDFINCVTNFCNELANTSHKPKKKKGSAQKQVKVKNTEETVIAVKPENPSEQTQQVLNSSTECSKKVVDNKDNIISDMLSGNQAAVMEKKEIINDAEILKIIGIDYGTNCVMYE